MDCKGYVIGGLSFLLILPSVLLLIVLVDMVNLDESTNIMIKSDTSFGISGDIERNIPIITMQALKESVEEVIETGKAMPNSRMMIKKSVESKMNSLSSNYQNNTGLVVMCTINSVDSALDPFAVEVNSSISVRKDNISYNRNISQDISILGLNYPKKFSERFDGIPDPLPFIKCKSFGCMSVNGDRISYGSSLSNYLSTKGLKDSEVYENASSPFYIKKCPYNPYTSHVSFKKFSTLKNCIDNGYYHESSDGACFLCRLEGKSVCSHYGFETFVTPAGCDNKSVMYAPCSIDHVIFNDKTYYGIYRGEAVEYFFTEHLSFRIFLDNGHKNKYGLIF